MGALHPLGAKVQEYTQRSSFKHIAILFEHLELRRQYAEEIIRYQHQESGLSHLEEINNRIMAYLHIPIPEKEESIPNRIRNMGEHVSRLEEQSALRQNRIETLEKSLQLILGFITEATGRNVDQSMVKELCSNINRTAREALKR